MPEKDGQHPVEIIAKVKSMELNLDHSGAYQLLLEDGSTIQADFTAWQWGHLESMHRRGEFPLSIIGVGDFAHGRLRRIVSIDLKKTDRALPPEDPEMPTLWHKISEISKSMDWANVPTDGAKNLHHYLYGRAKVDS